MYFFFVVVCVCVCLCLCVSEEEEEDARAGECNDENGSMLLKEEKCLHGTS